MRKSFIEKPAFNTFSVEKRRRTEEKESKEEEGFVPLSPEVQYFLHETSMGRLLSSIMESPEGTAIKGKRGRNFSQDMLLLKAEGLIRLGEGKLKATFQTEEGKLPKSISEKIKETFFKTLDGKILKEIEKNPGILTSELASKLSRVLNCSHQPIERRVKKLQNSGLIRRERRRGKRLANFLKEEEES